MARLLIIGADNLGTITEKLKGHGFKEVIHITGRKVTMVRKEIPSQIDVIFVMTDYVNHNLAKVMKQKAREQQIPTYFVKRSWCAIYKLLQEKEKAIGLANGS